MNTHGASMPRARAGEWCRIFFVNTLSWFVTSGDFAAALTQASGNPWAGSTARVFLTDEQNARASLTLRYDPKSGTDDGVEVTATPAPHAGSGGSGGWFSSTFSSPAPGASSSPAQEGSRLRLQQMRVTQLRHCEYSDFGIDGAAGGNSCAEDSVIGDGFAVNGQSCYVLPLDPREVTSDEAKEAASRAVAEKIVARGNDKGNDLQKKLSANEDYRKRKLEPYLLYKLVYCTKTVAEAVDAGRASWSGAASEKSAAKQMNELEGLGIYEFTVQPVESDKNQLLSHRDAPAVDVVENGPAARRTGTASSFHGGMPTNRILKARFVQECAEKFAKIKDEECATKKETPEVAAVVGNLVMRHLLGTSKVEHFAAYDHDGFLADQAEAAKKLLNAVAGTQASSGTVSAAAASTSTASNTAATINPGTLTTAAPASPSTSGAARNATEDAKTYVPAAPAASDEVYGGYYGKLKTVVFIDETVIVTGEHGATNPPHEQDAHLVSTFHPPLLMGHPCFDTSSQLYAATSEVATFFGNRSYVFPEDEDTKIKERANPFPENPAGDSLFIGEHQSAGTKATSQNEHAHLVSANNPCTVGVFARSLVSYFWTFNQPVTSRAAEVTDAEVTDPNGGANTADTFLLQRRDDIRRVETLFGTLGNGTVSSYSKGERKLGLFEQRRYVERVSSISVSDLVTPRNLPNAGERTHLASTRAGEGVLRKIYQAPFGEMSTSAEEGTNLISPETLEDNQRMLADAIGAAGNTIFVTLRVNPYSAATAAPVVDSGGGKSAGAAGTTSVVGAAALGLAGGEDKDSARTSASVDYAFNYQRQSYFSHLLGPVLIQHRDWAGGDYTPVKIHTDLHFQDVINHKKKAILYYFGYKNCPCCQRFTPTLAEWYSERSEDSEEQGGSSQSPTHAKTKLRDFEIVFISHDGKVEETEAYYSHHPWPMVVRDHDDYGNWEQLMRGHTCADCPKVTRYPTMIMVDARTGKFIKKFVGDGTLLDNLLDNLPSDEGDVPEGTQNNVNIVGEEEQSQQQGNENDKLIDWRTAKPTMTAFPAPKTDAVHLAGAVEVQLRQLGLRNDTTRQDVDGQTPWSSLLPNTMFRVANEFRYALPLAQLQSIGIAGVLHAGAETVFRTARSDEIECLLSFAGERGGTEFRFCGEVEAELLSTLLPKLQKIQLTTYRLPHQAQGYANFRVRAGRMPTVIYEDLPAKPKPKASAEEKPSPSTTPAPKVSEAAKTGGDKTTAGSSSSTSSTPAPKEEEKYPPTTLEELERTPTVYVGRRTRSVRKVTRTVANTARLCKAAFSVISSRASPQLFGAKGDIDPSTGKRSSITTEAAKVSFRTTRFLMGESGGFSGSGGLPGVELLVHDVGAIASGMKGVSSAEVVNIGASSGGGAAVANGGFTVTPNLVTPHKMAKCAVDTSSNSDAATLESCAAASVPQSSGMLKIVGGGSNRAEADLLEAIEKRGRRDALLAGEIVCDMQWGASERETTERDAKSFSTEMVAIEGEPVELVEANEEKRSGATGRLGFPALVLPKSAALAGDLSLLWAEHVHGWWGEPILEHKLEVAAEALKAVAKYGGTKEDWQRGVKGALRALPEKGIVVEPLPIEGGGSSTTPAPATPAAAKDDNKEQNRGTDLRFNMPIVAQVFEAQSPLEDMRLALHRRRVDENDAVPTTTHVDGLHSKSSSQSASRGSPSSRTATQAVEDHDFDRDPTGQPLLSDSTLDPAYLRLHDALLVMLVDQPTLAPPEHGRSEWVRGARFALYPKFASSATKMSKDLVGDSTKGQEWECWPQTTVLAPHSIDLQNGLDNGFVTASGMKPETATTFGAARAGSSSTLVERLTVQLGQDILLLHDTGVSDDRMVDECLAERYLKTEKILKFHVGIDSFPRDSTPMVSIPVRKIRDKEVTWEVPRVLLQQWTMEELKLQFLGHFARQIFPKNTLSVPNLRRYVENGHVRLVLRRALTGKTTIPVTAEGGGKNPQTRSVMTEETLSGDGYQKLFAPGAAFSGGERIWGAGNVLAAGAGYGGDESGIAVAGNQVVELAIIADRIRVKPREPAAAGSQQSTEKPKESTENNAVAPPPNRGNSQHAVGSADSSARIATKDSPGNIISAKNLPVDSLHGAENQGLMARWFPFGSRILAAGPDTRTPQSDEQTFFQRVVQFLFFCGLLALVSTVLFLYRYYKHEKMQLLALASKMHHKSKAGSESCDSAMGLIGGNSKVSGAQRMVSLGQLDDEISGSRVREVDAVYGTL